jgi:hypothetical protein
MWQFMPELITALEARGNGRASRRTGMRVRAGGVASSLACLLVAGCAHDPLWRTDQHVTIVAPHQLALASPPVTLSWRTHALPPASREFAVFIDRRPVKPGESLRAIANGDQSCLRNAGCPDPAYLRARNVFLTAGTRISIPYFAQLSGISGADQPSVHEATVVLIDAGGRRVGEYAYTVQFRVSDSGG